VSYHTLFSGSPAPCGFQKQQKITKNVSYDTILNYYLLTIDLYEKNISQRRGRNQKRSASPGWLYLLLKAVFKRRFLVLIPQTTRSRQKAVRKLGSAK
jgi:hypothetical protein